MGHVTTGLGRTVHAEAFGKATEPPAPPSAAPEGDAPTLARASVASAQARRFAIGSLLGAGATSQVYALEDRDLARSVAIKLLAAPDGAPAADEVARFIEEARITASLSHPNVLPVHDIDVDDRGRVFFTMTRVEGLSLGALIEQSGPDARIGALADANALVSVAIGVCQALAFAHRRGIVHQDIKPDNIMLGEFGEVLVVDWGSARRGVIDEAHLYGTPLYMSPEQARRERADARSDVYCIGATLFHALTLRLPTWHDDTDAFWRAKREGAIDPPGDHERAGCPPALLAIALKALAADPARRYADASAMLEDLRRYQAGLAVSALRESPWQTFRRWHARNGRTFWSWSAAAVVMLALGALLWGKHVEEMARWGRPIVAETFEDEGWTARWSTVEGGFAVRDGRLVSTGEFANIAMLRKPLRGAVAIEYEAEMLPGGNPCDISAVWARGMRPRAEGGDELVDPYLFQVGAFDGAHCAISQRSVDVRMHVAYAAFRPEAGRRYRVRVEVEGSRLSLSLDGRLLCSWSDAFMFSGGHLGLYGHYAEKAFDQVRIYQREVPAKVSAIAIGDAAARAGVHELAAAEYRQVAESHAGTPLGAESTYKHGWCLWRLGREAEAERVWADAAGTRFAPRIALHRAEARAGRGEHAQAIADIEAVRAHGEDDVRAEAAASFARLLAARRGDADRAELRRYLDAYERSFADAGAIGSVAASAYFDCGRYQEVVDRFPGLRFMVSISLLSLGRYDEVIRDFPDQRYPAHDAYFQAGRFDGLGDFPGSVQSATALVQQGRFADCVRDFAAAYPSIAAQALTHAGRFAEADAMLPADAMGERGLLLVKQGRAEEAAASDDPRIRHAGLVALGRWRELVRVPPDRVPPDRVPPDRVPTDPSAMHVRWGTCMAAIEAWIGGERDPVALRPPSASWSAHPDQLTYLLDLAVLPFLDAVHRREFAAFERMLAAGGASWRWKLQQRAWYDAEFLLGRMDEPTYLAQPARAFAPVRLLMLRAMRHERHGRSSDALADWRAWLASPLHARDEMVNGAYEALARWRVRELGG